MIIKSGSSLDFCCQKCKHKVKVQLYLICVLSIKPYFCSGYKTASGGKTLVMDFEECGVPDICLCLPPDRT